MKDEKRQHLEFIQNIISRMNSNSFQLKGISITIILAIMSIYVATSNKAFIFIGIMSTTVYWLLDSYYLQQERKFRGIYNDITKTKRTFNVRLYEISPNKYTKKIDNKYSYINALFSKIIIIQYISTLILITITGLITIVK